MATFEVFSNRWGHTDHYRIERTPTGWSVSHISINGESDKSGKPFLYSNFEQDSINWPSGLPDAMETLWEHAQQQALSDEQLQPYLAELAEWVSTCERARPGGIFQ